MKTGSLPSQERGLKYHDQMCVPVSLEVAPPAGAWIEIAGSARKRSWPWSLPLWERGLKLSEHGAAEHFGSRSPRGSVD